MRSRLGLAALLLLSSACTKSTDIACEGEQLFGRPVANTGLDDTQCQPTCSCGGETWTPPAYDRSAIDALKALELIDPPALLESNPYEGDKPAAPGEDEVCGVIVEGTTYQLQSFANAAAAEDANARVTHGGRCGVCSTLEDLAVYMSSGDLTEPVRACGLENLFGPPEAHIECLTNLGFTMPCAQIWYYNTKSTQQKCSDQCFSAVDEPYHLPDGSLNPCLDCDEKRSGAVFKAIAGRTRRNTGLASALCRPCREVLRIDHVYQ